MTEDEKALELAVISPDFTRTEVNELCTGRRYERYRKARIRHLLWQAECALWRQRRIGQKMRQRETRFVDGVGQHVACVDEFLRHAMTLMYGRDCWSNKDKREFIFQKFPEMRVPSPTPRIRVNGFRQQHDGPARATGMVPGENLATTATDSRGVKPVHETPAACVP